MYSVNIADAKAHFSELVQRAEAGEEVLIMRRGQPVARLSAAEQPRLPVDFAAADSIRERLSAYAAGVDSAALVRQSRDERY